MLGLSPYDYYGKRENSDEMMKDRVSGDKRSTLRRWLLVGATLLLVAGLVAGYREVTFVRPPLPEAVAALESDAQVLVTQTPWLTFSPAATTPDTGFIFYPGGRIDPQGYAPLLRAIAEAGYLVVVPEMPLNMAVFDANVADDIRAAYPEIEQWGIGGHSVGGTMAAQYARSHPDAVAGLTIWASYPAGNADLSAADLPVSIIYGSLDTRADEEAVLARRHLLPPDTTYVRLDGGDHHQFGSYEIAPEDEVATLDSKEQQRQIITATLEMLAAMTDTE